MHGWCNRFIRKALASSRNICNGICKHSYHSQRICNKYGNWLLSSRNFRKTFASIRKTFASLHFFSSNFPRYLYHCSCNICNGIRKHSYHSQRICKKFATVWESHWKYIAITINALPSIRMVCDCLRTCCESIANMVSWRILGACC